MPSAAGAEAVGADALATIARIELARARALSKLRAGVSQVRTEERGPSIDQNRSSQRRGLYICVILDSAATGLSPPYSPRLTFLRPPGPAPTEGKISYVGIESTG